MSMILLIIESLIDLKNKDIISQAKSVGVYFRIDINEQQTKIGINGFSEMVPRVLLEIIKNINQFILWPEISDREFIYVRE